MVDALWSCGDHGSGSEPVAGSLLSLPRQRSQCSPVDPRGMAELVRRWCRWVNPPRPAEEPQPGISKSAVTGTSVSYDIPDPVLRLWNQ